MACYRCWRGEPAMVGTEFSLLGFCALRAVQNSPCFCILGKNSRYFACWESFVPLGACSAGCGESFVLGRSFSDAVGFTVMTSLCSGRENVRPAREKWPKNRGSWRAGRVFSRKRRLRASAGRTLSRKGPDVPRAGRDFSRKTSLACLCWANFVVGPDVPRAGRVLSRPGHRGVLLGDQALRCFQSDCDAGIFFHVAATRTRPSA